MYEEILLPVDESTASTAVLPHVAELAHGIDASVRLLHVADTGRDSVTVAGTEVVDALEQQGEEVVADADETLASLGVTCTTDVVQGTPASTVVDYAERYDYDLIALATHGRRGLSRALLGSVAEKVIRLSEVPVLTVRGRDDERFSFPYERLLVATDGSEQAGRAVEHALALADAIGATVHALTVVEDAGMGPDIRSIVREENKRAARETTTAVADAAPDGVEVVTHVDEGAPDEVIREYVESVDAHAVVLGTTGRRGIDRVLLGSVAEKTARTAPVPVITVGGDGTQQS